MILISNNKQKTFSYEGIIKEMNRLIKGFSLSAIVTMAISSPIQAISLSPATINSDEVSLFDKSLLQGKKAKATVISRLLELTNSEIAKQITNKTYQTDLFQLPLDTLISLIQTKELESTFTLVENLVNIEPEDGLYVSAKLESPPRESINLANLNNNDLRYDVNLIKDLRNIAGELGVPTVVTQTFGRWYIEPQTETPKIESPESNNNKNLVNNPSNLEKTITQPSLTQPRSLNSVNVVKQNRIYYQNPAFRNNSTRPVSLFQQKTRPTSPVQLFTPTTKKVNLVQPPQPNAANFNNVNFTNNPNPLSPNQTNPTKNFNQPRPINQNKNRVWQEKSVFSP